LIIQTRDVLTWTQQIDHRRQSLPSILPKQPPLSRRIFTLLLQCVSNVNIYFIVAMCLKCWYLLYCCNVSQMLIFTLLLQCVSNVNINFIVAMCLKCWYFLYCCNVSQMLIFTLLLQFVSLLYTIVIHMYIRVYWFYVTYPPTCGACIIWKCSFDNCFPVHSLLSSFNLR
jgi:hypothetical protein